MPDKIETVDEEITLQEAMEILAISKTRVGDGVAQLTKRVIAKYDADNPELIVGLSVLEEI